MTEKWGIGKNTEVATNIQTETSKDKLTDGQINRERLKKTDTETEI